MSTRYITLRKNKKGQAWGALSLSVFSWLKLSLNHKFLHLGALHASVNAFHGDYI
jgi:hypothetical protein